MVFLFMIDDHRNVVPIEFKSYKSKRDARSAVAGEMIEFSNLLDRAAILSANTGDFTK